MRRTAGSAVRLKNMRENPIVSGYRNKYERTLSSESPDAPYPQVVEFVQKYGQQLGRRVADLGGGNGRNLIYLSQAGYEPIGVELTPQGAQATKKHLEKLGLKSEVVIGNINTLPFDNASFESAISRRVFDYSDDAEAREKFQEAARILKPNALMFLSVRSAEQAPKSNETLEFENQYGGKTFLVESGSEKGAKQHYFTEAELRYLAEDSGFEVLKLQPRAYRGKNDNENKFEFILELRKSVVA